MTDRYLLESGAPDGYLLEDSSGVLLLQSAPTTVAVGIVEETDQTLSVTWQRRLTLGQPETTDTALPVTVTGPPGTYRSPTINYRATNRTYRGAIPPQIVTLGQPESISQTLSITWQRRLTLNQPESVNQTLSVTSRRSRTLGQPATTDTPLAIARAKRIVLTQPTTLDVALLLTDGGSTIVVALGLPTTTDTALALSRTKTYVLSQPEAVHETLPVLWHPKIRQVGLVVDSSQALGIGAVIVVIPPPGLFVGDEQVIAYYNGKKIVRAFIGGVQL